MDLDKSNGKKPEHAKSINNVRNNGENPWLIEQIMALKQIKIQSLLWATRSVIIVGDSISHYCGRLDQQPWRPIHVRMTLNRKSIQLRCG